MTVAVAALFAAACGRQVSPNPPGAGAAGAGTGFMSVKLDIAAPFNFANYQYWIVFNTSGNGLTPDTRPLQSNWAAYSDALLVSGNAGASFASIGQFVKNSNPHIPPTFVQLGTTPQQFTYTANSNGSGTEFTVLFQRSIFSNVRNSPSPSPSPLANVWTFNAFTTQANTQNQMIFVDSMGVGGPVDPQFLDTPPQDVRQCFDTVVYALNGGLQIDPAAQIVTVEIGNNPSPGPASTPCP